MGITIEEIKRYYFSLTHFNPSLIINLTHIICLLYLFTHVYIINQLLR